MPTLAGKDRSPHARPMGSGLQTLWVGIDIGSTTVKTVAIDPGTRRIVFWRYERHNACQVETLYRLLETLHREFSDAKFRIAACGSGSEPIVEEIGGAFIQEVIATSVALREWYPHVRTAVELGGQDAKILLFKREDGRDRSVLADMRMNGSCAGGTGAFIDQMAMLLGTEPEHFNGIASRGGKVHPISGRCGVFAKTDILPLINNGIPREDIALSVFHAVVNQTICSLAQGMAISAPVAFMGGPLSYNSVLVDAFAGKLGMDPASIIIPEHSLVMAAAGAALSAGESGEARAYRGPDALRRVAAGGQQRHEETGVPFFATDAEYVDFTIRHANPRFVPAFPARGTVLETFVGVDAGSTTLKIVLMDGDGKVLNTHYANNGGDTIGSATRALLSLAKQYDGRGIDLRIMGVGTTGYGEQLCARVLGADFHTVETVAHAAAALALYPDATFLLDIGGQDMKAISIADGVIRDVYLNEACSSGCGSFIEATARNLGVPVERIAETAFRSRNPASLGSRCTVFMLASVTTEQKNGKVTEDIVAGLCRSIVENVFSKVLRVADVGTLGDRIVVQGGTFKNDAVLRAFEQYAGRPVHRPPHCGEMGAYGAALLARDAMRAGGKAQRTGFIGFDALRNLGRPETRSSVCTGCGNRCSRDIVAFPDGLMFCTGHRCEKGDVSSDRAGGASAAAEETAHRAPEPMTVLKERLLLGEPSDVRRILPANGVTVGLPLVFEFWNSMPFWRTVFTALGFDVALSGTSTRNTAEEGSRFAASDSICFPAKLMHGHIETLMKKRVDRIFAPALKTHRGRSAEDGTVHMCPVVQGLPLMARHLNRPAERGGIPVDEPVFGFETGRMRDRQIARYFHDAYGIGRRDVMAAVEQGDAALARFNARLHRAFGEQLDAVRRTDGFGVLLLGRPYHADSLVNHRIPGIFASMGIPVLLADGIPALPAVDGKRLRPEAYNPFHTELYAAALYAAREPALEAVQLVSFGCGHDAITTDEIGRLMAGTGGKRPLVLKIDDGDCRSALTIRIRSFVETVRKRRASR